MVAPVAPAPESEKKSIRDGTVAIDMPKGNSKARVAKDVNSPTGSKTDVAFSRRPSQSEEAGIPSKESIRSKSIPRIAPSLQNMTYAWKNVNVWGGKGGCKTKLWKSKAPPKQLLRDAYGIIRPGELVAIMGASGAGKTTLLNCLTFRNSGKLHIQGEFFVNGAVVGKRDIKAISAYIEQEDLFIGSMTVREHLYFTARVRMESSIPMKERLIRVEEIMKRLGILECADTVIGIPGKLKGISGGQKKKLSFASEVLTDPKLMFCDEPTSGLDSFGAHNIVSVLQGLAAEGRTIISTIHQPSSSVFAMFNHVMLVAEGRLAYLGQPAAALRFFAEIGYKCPSNYNPADFFIETLAVHPDQKETATGMICEAFDKTPMAAQIMDDIDNKLGLWVGSAEAINAASKKRRRNPYRAGWFRQFGAVLKRTFVAFIRDKVAIGAQILNTIFLALLVGYMFKGQEHDREGVQNINGCLFLCINLLTYQYCFAVIDDFSREQPIFFREYRSAMYRADVYFLCKTIISTPVFILLPVIFAAICYFIVGLKSQHFLWTVVIFILIANIGAAFGFMISILAPSLSVALVVGPGLIIPLSLFGGFFVNSQSIDDWIQWLQYISWFFHANEALEIVHWQDVTEIDCGLHPACPPNGSEVLEYMSIEPDKFHERIIFLAVLLVVYRLLGLVGLIVKAFSQS